MIRRLIGITALAAITALPVVAQAQGVPAVSNEVLGKANGQPVRWAPWSVVSSAASSVA